MSLDVHLTATKPVMVFDANITHNMIDMAKAADLYQCCWRPEEISITKAEQLIEPLSRGIETLKADPDKFKAFNPSNGWGDYDDFVRWLENYLAACKRYPDADVDVSR